MKRRKETGLEFEVKNARPEDSFEPADYYATEDGQHEVMTSGMERMQVLIARRLDELLGIESGKEILDVGIATGFGAEYFRQKGHAVSGIDIAKNLVDISREKGFSVKHGDMRNIDAHFEENSFDYIVSVSALQWLKGREEDLQKVARGMHKVIRPGGKIGIQFYPKNTAELNAAKRAFAKYFNGNIVADNWDNPRKSRIYLVLTPERKNLDLTEL